MKNVATGSTTRKYPELFPEGHVFQRPVVKFDFRNDLEDQPIADDYVREAGLDPKALKRIALRINELLKSWLAPRNLVDFCLVIGESVSGELLITSEISPDCMRLKDVDGSSLDKDLFRFGASGSEIVRVWGELARDIAEGA